MKIKFMIKRIVIIIFVLFFVISYTRQFLTMNKIQKEIEAKEIQLSEIQEKNERLQDEVDKINSDSSDYIEKLARERLGMIKPGEKVVNIEETK